MSQLKIHEEPLTPSPAPLSRPAAPLAGLADSAEASPAGLGERQRIIDEIRLLNPTAGVQFLSEFSTLSLHDYLEHLRHIRHKHVRLPGWIQRRTARLAEARRAIRKAS